MSDATIETTAAGAVDVMASEAETSAAMAAAAAAVADAMATAEATAAMVNDAAAAAAAAVAATAPQVVLEAGVFSGATTDGVDASHAVEAAMASLAPPPAAQNKHKTRSTNLTHEQKRLICLYARQNPTFTQAQLGKWAKEQFGLSTVPSQSSISHTLKRRHTFEHMKSEDWSSKRMRTVKYPELDTALANWFLYCQARQVRIQGDEIKAKAQTFFDMMQLGTVDEGPQFSNGWLHSFQSRHGFSRSPNTHTSDHELVTSRDELVELTKGVAPWDIYWMDETKLSFALNPENLASAMMGETKEKQMGIALCCNTDGSDMMDPFFICDHDLGVATEAEPAGRAVDYGFTYAHNKKVWMTPTLFREWMLSFDWKMHEENRHVLLLLDAFSSHQVKRMVLKNVTVRIVTHSAFVESFFDSVEHSVFSAVKRRYRQFYLENVLDKKDERKDDVYDIEEVEAIQLVLKAWRQTPKAVIADAFTQVGITIEDTPPNAEPVAQNEEKVEAEIAALLKRLKLKNPVKAVDFIAPLMERVVDEDFTDQDFVDCALEAGLSVNVPGRNVEPPRKMVRMSRAKKSFPTGSVSNVLATRGVAAQRPPAARMAMGADDLAPAGIPDEEWQAWADSQRYRIDELHALETVIRLGNEMKCEQSTMLDLNRMYAELIHKKHPERAATLGITTSESAATTPSSDPKQPAGVCRFSFGAGTTTI